jgi:hypothetical protein
MNAILLEGESNQNVKLILNLAHKLGFKAKKVSQNQLEDHILAMKIEAGMKSDTVSKLDVLNILNSK